MAARRAIWKGTINFGLVNIPVALVSATEGSAELSFNMLDKRDKSPVGYRRVNKSTGEEVAWKDIVKGYEISDGNYVLITDEDFKKANVAATQSVDIVGFVDPAEIDPRFYETPYYLAPDKRGEKAYALLREVLEKTHKVGLATVVIRTRQHLAAVIPHRGILVLELLRFAHEVRDEDAVDAPKTKVSPKELEMAERLVEGMVEKFEPKKYKDTFHDDMLALIEKKAEGEDIEPVNVPQSHKGKVVDLMSLLKQSVETASAKATHRGGTGTRKPPKRAKRPSRQRVKKSA